MNKVKSYQNLDTWVVLRGPLIDVLSLVEKIMPTIVRPNHSYIRLRFQPIQIIGPCLHHCNAVVDELRAVIGRSECVRYFVRKLVLDDLSGKSKPFVEDR